ncbi:MAG: threonine--tRNA ligase [bacterium]|nr:threonine--tRNA ligase [bacterium]
MPIENIRHSLSHLMSMAIMEKYPKAGLGVGPAIENGFYQDYDLPEAISEKDFGWIEKRMRELIAKKIKFAKSESDFANALKFYEHDPYKTEMINDLKVAGEKKLSFYDSDWFHNLCAGPHVSSTNEISPDAFKLTKLAGAYWRGSEKNKMLTRIYGVAFSSKKELEDYLKQLAEAEKRDHRKIGREQDLFSFYEKAPGFPFWHPKGMVLRESLMTLYSKMCKEAGYISVSTPILLPEELWRQSGHWDNYKDNMYFTEIEGKTFAIKPMNCPGVSIIYKNHPRSYRDLPLRFAETGEVHRHEPSGTLHGLFRVRAFRQDDAHIFCREDQIEKEVKDIIKLALKFYKMLSFKEVNIELSTRPEKSIGTNEVWEKAESILKKILTGLKLKFKINEGDGAFYGPKIDFHIKDSIGRSWQCATIQLDFSMPERFDLKYTDKDGSAKRPVMIHRTIIGSIQRFIGVLIEHFGGAFPLWLSPEQVWVVPITDKHIKYAKQINSELITNNFRTRLKDDNETVSKKIREGEMQKIPYLLIVGDKEIKSKSVAVRQRGKGDLGAMKLSKFLKKVKIEEEAKR